MPVTALYAALLTFLLIGLAFRVVGARIGRMDKPVLHSRIRVHGNLTENAPLFVILLGICEQSGGDPRALHLAGSAFFVARLLHAFGLSRSAGASPPRFIGTALSWSLMLAMGGYAVALNWA